jgi:hypothetical protein
MRLVPLEGSQNSYWLEVTSGPKIECQYFWEDRSDPVAYKNQGSEGNGK